MNNARITIRLDQKTEHRLREEATAAGKNESEFLRDLIAEHFARSPRPATALEIASRAGIIGCASGLPADLSANKDHLEGFGR